MTDDNVLPVGSNRTQGKQAHQINISIATTISDLVRTTLGPKGMDKILVDGLNDVTVTNDGATILREIQANAPAAQMIIDMSRQQDAEVGDGTTSVVVIAGELLQEASELLKKGVHPTIICKGYLKAREEAIRILEGMSEDYQDGDLEAVARTAMTGKGAESRREELAKIVVEAVESVEEKEHIRVEARPGSDILDTRLVRGSVLRRTRCHPNMPKELKDAKVLLIEEALQYKDLSGNSQIQITNPGMMREFQDSEEAQIAELVNKIEATGCNMVVCNKGVDEPAAYALAKLGILAIQRVAREDLEQISRATGAKILTKLADTEDTDVLGTAMFVKQSRIGDDEVTIVEGPAGCGAVTLLIRASTDHLAQEIKRAVEDAVGDVWTVKKHKKILFGAGNTEIRLSGMIGEYAKTLQGREQLAVQAFANSLEIIPESIAENAGLDPIDSLAELKANISAAETEKSSARPGLNVEGGTFDTREQGVIEPLELKKRCVGSAADVAVMLLRIDDIVAVNKNPNAPPESVQSGEAFQ